MRIDAEVLKVIGAANVEGNKLVLTGQLDRNLYQRTDKVLQAAGGKWNRGLKAHVFDSCAESRIQQMLSSGDIVIPQDFGYYPTPEPVVQMLMDLADVQPGMLCLEPSAGQGAIACALAKVAGGVMCVELLDQNVTKLRENLSAICNEGPDFQIIRHGDFLEMPVGTDSIYDRIVMNPPFEKQADIKHVLHAFDFLKPGGRLVSVMSASVLFRSNKLTQEFRDFVEQQGGTIEPLPEGSFKVSGTMVNTVVVVLDK